MGSSTFGLTLPRAGRPSANLGGLTTQATPASTSSTSESTTKSTPGPRTLSPRSPTPGGRTKSVTSKTQADAGSRFPSAMEALSRTAAGERGAEAFGGAGRVSQRVIDRIGIESLKKTNPGAVRILEGVLDRSIQAVERFSDDQLASTKGVLVNNALFSPRERFGLARFRPEILSVLDFLPGYDSTDKEGKSLTGAGQVLDLEYQALVIRNTMLKSLMEEIQGVDPAESTASRALQEVGAEFAKGRAQIRTVLDAYANWLESLDQYRLSLDVKSLPGYAFDQVRGQKTLTEVFERYLGIPAGVLHLYTDTKVIHQLIHDLGWVLNNYSPSLVNSEILGRSTDTNPVRIRTDIRSVGRSLGFQTSAFASPGTRQRASEPSWFLGFLNTLPSLPADRVKVLVAVLSKEIRVSRVLGTAAAQTRLRDLYQTTPTGNPFDNIIGKPGTHILEDPLGPPGCLATLTHVNQETDDGTVRVLPFESKYFDDNESNRVFVPGTDYFIDSVLENLPKKNGFDTEPFSEFVTSYQKTVENAKTTIGGLLDLGRPQGPAHPLRLFQGMLRGFQASMSGLIGARSGARNLDQGVLVALMALANQDQTLKNMLFEFSLLLGMAGRQGDKNDKVVWKRIAGDYQNIQGFAFLKTGKKDAVSLLAQGNTGATALGPWVEGLAADIEARVLQVTRPGFGNANLDAQTGSGRGSSKSVTNTDHIDQTTLPPGALQEILVRCARVDAGTASPNVIKQVLDAITGIDAGNLGGEGSEGWLLPDGSGRTRFHFLSTSTVAMMVYEVYASLVNLVGGVTFRTRTGNTTSGSSRGSLTLAFDQEKLTGAWVALEDAVSRSPTQDPVTYHDHLNVPALTSLGQTPPGGGGRGGIRNPRDITSRIPAGLRGTVGGTSGTSPSASSDGIRRITEIAGGGSDGLTRILDPSGGGGGSSGASGGDRDTLARTVVGNVSVSALLARSRSPGRTADLVNVLGASGVGESILALVQLRDITDKLDEENRVVTDLLNVLEVVGKRLESARTQMLRKFNGEALTKFYSDTGMTFEDLASSILLIPSQVRTSAYLYDWYTSRVTVSDAAADTSAGPVTFVDDLIPASRRDALFAWLRDGRRRGALVSKTLKLFTVGLPAGLSDQLSDRVGWSKTGVNLRSQDTNDKQFDLVSVNVYKRDARFDDIVFKPQKFLFDMSLFLPGDVPKETNTFPENGSWNTWVKDQVLADYQSVLRPKALTLAEAQSRAEYRFLGPGRVKAMFENHLQSEILDLYTQFLTGMTMSEDSFLEKEVQLSGVVQGTALRLVLEFLRDFKGKQIPQGALTAEEVLANPDLDEETRDLVTLLSYGNLLFHTTYLKRNILGMKKFDRVFTIPVDTEAFEVDVDLTLSTPGGRAAWSQEVVQDTLEYSVDRATVKVAPRGAQDVVFSDYFVVVEAVTK